MPAPWRVQQSHRFLLEHRRISRRFSQNIIHLRPTIFTTPVDERGLKIASIHVA
jgi:hypothetical protein